MSSTNKTPNLELSQLVGNDIFTFMGDYNSDMAKIDEAVQTNKENIATNDQTVEALGIRVGNAEQSVAVAEEQVAEFGEQVTAMKVNLDDLHHEVAEDEKRIEAVEESTVELEERVEDLETSTAELESQLKVGSQKFYFDEKDGKFGYNTDEGRGADTFHPFKAGGGEPDFIEAAAYAVTQTQLSFNIKELYADYANITIDNMVIQIEAVHVILSSATRFVYEYTPETGILLMKAVGQYYNTENASFNKIKIAIFG